MSKQLLFHQALSDPTRLRIAALLQGEALCVCELADVLQLAQSTVSTHLQSFKAADLVETERCDKWIYYRLRAQTSLALDQLKALIGSDDAARQTKLDLNRCCARLRQRAASCCAAPASPSRPRRGVRPQALPQRLAN